MNIVLVAEESAGIQALRLILSTPHRLIAVLSSSDAARGATVGGVARNNGVDVLPAEQVKDRALAPWMQKQNVDLLLNVHSLYVVDPAVVAAPRIGSFNLHPGPLPAYAGLNAPSWAIYNGEVEHAVTLHWMETGIDTGAIAYDARFGISPTDTGLTVSAAGVRLGVPLLQRLLETAGRSPSDIPAIPQRGKRRYHSTAPPNGGWIDWAEAARRVTAFVRAADFAPFRSPWGNPRTLLEGVPVEILKATQTAEPCTAAPGVVGEASERAARVATADEWVEVQRVRLGGSAAEAADVLTPGARLAGPDLEG
jgi:methionyl-tRNA formyltransferase